MSYQQQHSTSHLDGEVIPHVVPDFDSAQVGHLTPSACGSVIVKVPPDGIEHADQPVTRKQQVDEQEDARGCWGHKDMYITCLKPVGGPYCQQIILN